MVPDQTLRPVHCVQGTPGAAFHRDSPLDSVGVIFAQSLSTLIPGAFRENIGPDGNAIQLGLVLLYMRGGFAGCLSVVWRVTSVWVGPRLMR